LLNAGASRQLRNLSRKILADRSAEIESRGGATSDASELTASESAALGDKPTSITLLANSFCSMSDCPPKAVS
jgi:hypothetical protein